MKTKKNKDVNQIAKEVDFAFIVRAVNSHEALLEAANTGMALAHYKKDYETYEKIKGLITQAEGK